MEDMAVDVATRLAYALTTTPGLLGTRQAYAQTPTPSMNKMEECLHWDDVKTDQVGEMWCVSGVVVNAYEGERGDIITFSNSPDDFFLVSYDEIMFPSPGTCILVRGVIRQLGMTPVILVTPKNMIECPPDTEK
jgi:hypothetical protein